MRGFWVAVLAGVWSTSFVVVAEVAGATGAPSAIEEKVLELTNLERAEMGIAPLRWENRLGRAAQGHSVNMARTQRFAHTLDGRDPGHRIRAEGYVARRWSENIFMGGGPYGSAEAAVDAWMRSSGHRANLLDRHVTELGVGVRQSARGFWYFTQKFARP
jgi:uncharacterized protein YkwD